MQRLWYPRWLQWLLSALAILLLFGWIIPVKLLGFELDEAGQGYGAVVAFILCCVIAENVRRHTRMR